jgi:hypothetical protein
MPLTKKTSTSITRDDYNNLVAIIGGPSSLNSPFDADLRMNKLSTSLIVKTPDGTKHFRIRVDFLA